MTNDRYESRPKRIIPTRAFLHCPGENHTKDSAGFVSAFPYTLHVSVFSERPLLSRATPLVSARERENRRMKKKNEFDAAFAASIQDGVGTMEMRGWTFIIEPMSWSCLLVWERMEGIFLYL